jgi:hypothetical protein
MEWPYSIRRPPRGLLVLLVPQLLGLRADADAVADLLDAHVLEMGLVHLHEVLAVDVVVWRGQHRIVCVVWSTHA